MDCERAASLLDGWLEEALPPAERAWMAAHLAACPACTATIAALDTVPDDVQAAVGALRGLAPSRDLWAGIAARIEAPVLVLDPASVRPFRQDIAAQHGGAAGRMDARPWWRTAVAAAALVACTAGITWRLAHDDRGEAAGASARIESVATRAPGATPAASGPVVSTTGIDTGATATGRVARDGGARGGATLATGPAPHGAGAAAVVPLAPLPAAARAYDQEIAALRALVAERRAELDPATAETLERNLRLIDQAVAESRAALAHDPDSGFLSGQITRTLRRKLELLRTAAVVPARST